MNSWEQFIQLYTHPAFWALLIFGMALPTILKKLRPFFPKALKESADKSEALRQTLENNEPDKKLLKKVHNIEGLLIFGPSLIALTLYLAYTYVNGAAFTPKMFVNALTHAMAPVMFLTMGVYAISREKVLRSLLKDDYQRFVELTEKANAVDPLVKFFEKHIQLIGYLIIAFGLFGLLYINLA